MANSSIANFSQPTTGFTSTATTTRSGHADQESETSYARCAIRLTPGERFGTSTPQTNTSSNNERCLDHETITPHHAANSRGLFIHSRLRLCEANGLPGRALGRMGRICTCSVYRVLLGACFVFWVVRMICPRCKCWSDVVETRTKEDHTKSRRYECTSGHRFTTIEYVREAAVKSKAGNQPNKPSKQ